jgi:uncharacterized protein
MKRPFYDPADPFCERRAPDDKEWGLDHVFKKLLVIPSKLHLATSQRLAEERIQHMHASLAQLKRELA